MGLSLGLVGLPNSGKSTLFNALTQAGAHVASYPFTTIEPNVGIVPVPNQRLDDLVQLVKPERVTPATIEFVDIAGLVEGASHGEGLGNQFLGHIRNVDAIALVLRAFTDQHVAHVYASVDPLRDKQTLSIELTLADLATVEKRMDRIRTAARTGDKPLLHELRLLEVVHGQLAAGLPLKLLPLDLADTVVLQSLNLLTIKPVLYIVNVAEDDLARVTAGEKNGDQVDQWVAAIGDLAKAEQAESIVVSAKLESELTDLSRSEAAEYRAMLGVEQTGLSELIHASYRLLHLVTFFTTTGGQEVRAWTIIAGTKAPEAAGKIHTDMEKGFIRAEVIAHDELMKAGTFAEARERGWLRVEGRDYVVKDGDVIHIRFSPPAKK